MFDDEAIAMHPPVPQKELEALLDALRTRLSASSADRLLPSDIDETATALGLKRAHAWVAAAFDPALAPDPCAEEIQVGICVGRCQMQGAVPNLEKLLEERDKRKKDGTGSFAITPRQCLDRCPHAPVAFCSTPQGSAGIPRMKPEEVPDLIDQLFALAE